MKDGLTTLARKLSCMAKEGVKSGEYHSVTYSSKRSLPRRYLFFFITARYVAFIVVTEIS